jgi:hypothetical protein
MMADKKYEWSAAHAFAKAEYDGWKAAYKIPRPYLQLDSFICRVNECLRTRSSSLASTSDAEVRTMYDVSVESMKGMIPRYLSVKEEREEQSHGHERLKMSLRHPLTPYNDADALICVLLRFPSIEINDRNEKIFSECEAHFLRPCLRHT